PECLRTSRTHRSRLPECFELFEGDRVASNVRRADGRPDRLHRQTRRRSAGLTMNYVLVTSARNEETVIEHTLRSVVAQTVPPLRWVIVDDGSTDRTAEIVRDYVRRYDWIVLLRRPRRVDRNFAGKVHAVNAGLEAMKDLSFEVFGNLDADVSFEPDYMEFLLQKFEHDPRLGVAGTPFTQDG